MKKILAILLVYCLSIVVIGCDTFTEPLPKGESVVVKDGDTIHFSVSYLNNIPSIYEPRWSAFSGISDQPLYSSETTQFELTIHTEELSNKSYVKFDKWGWYAPDQSYGSVSSRRWKLIVEQPLPIWKGNYIIHENNDISVLEGFTEITGHLYICSGTIGTYSAGLLGPTSLEGLSGITSIGGNLIVEETPLSNLSGLNNLTTVGGYILVRDNKDLTTLEDLNKIESIGNNREPSLISSLTIVYNDALAKLGLDALNSVEGGNITIGGNPKLCTDLAEEFIDRFPDNDVSHHLFLNRDCSM